VVGLNTDAFAGGTGADLTEGDGAAGGDGGRAGADGGTAGAGAGL